MSTGVSDEIFLSPGQDVYGSDESKVGTIIQVTDDVIVVEKGFFFPKDYYIPYSAIDGATEDGRIYLNLTKDEALAQAWDEAPETGYSETAEVDTTPSYVNAATIAATAASGSVDAQVIAPSYVAADDAAIDTQNAAATRVPVFEEELTAVTRPVSRGVVRIEKELVTEERTITVPVTEERVRVTRVDADQAMAADATGAFQGEVIEVPITGEEVSVEKHARQTGEVLIEKEAVQRTETASGTVRREEVHVDDDTVASADIDTDTNIRR